MVRRPHVLAAAAVAGTVGGVPSTVHALVTGGDPLAATRAASGLLEALRACATRHPPGSVVEVGGRSRSAQPERWRVPAGVAAHAAVSLAWAAVLVPLLQRVPRRRGRIATTASVALVGALAGAGVAALDLWIARRRVPAVAALPIAPQLADHLAYGAALGVVTARRSSVACARGSARRSRPHTQSR